MSTPLCPRIFPVPSRGQIMCCRWAPAQPSREPGVFRTACGKEYFECAKGEPLTIQFHLPSISFCLRESSCSVYVWQPKAARFQQIRMRD